jgi:hypothetical protein
VRQEGEVSELIWREEAGRKRKESKTWVASLKTSVCPCLISLS